MYGLPKKKQIFLHCLDSCNVIQWLLFVSGTSHGGKKKGKKTTVGTFWVFSGKHIRIQVKITIITKKIIS
jgi:hypothetical protein